MILLSDCDKQTTTTTFKRKRLRHKKKENTSVVFFTTTRERLFHAFFRVKSGFYLMHKKWWDESKAHQRIINGKVQSSLSLSKTLNSWRGEGSFYFVNYILIVLCCWLFGGIQQDSNTTQHEGDGHQKMRTQTSTTEKTFRRRPKKTTKSDEPKNVVVWVVRI